MAASLPALEVVQNEKGRQLRIIYTLSVTEQCVNFFAPYRIDSICKRRDEIALNTLEEGRIYHVAGLTVAFLGEFTRPDEQTLRMYTDRNEFVCGGKEVYREVIIPALLLGCRVRDYEQRCAVVDQIGALVLTMSMLPQNATLDNQSIKLQTVSGHSFTVQVKDVKQEGRRWKVFGKPTAVLPDDLKEGCQLLIEEGVPNQSPVTRTIFQFSKKEAIISSGPLLDCIYGLPGHRSQPAVAPYRSQILLRGGGVLLLNQEQLDAVAHYNCADCPAFVIEAPPGSGKTMTAAAMAVSYKGKGVQLFLSTANVPVKNMALALAKLDIGSRSPIHLISSEYELKLSEETHSPFSPLSLAKNNQRQKEQIEELEEALDYAPDEEKANIKKKIREEFCLPVLNEPHDIYFATVDTILNRLFKQNKKNNHYVDAVKKLLENDVVRVVIDEASQLTEAALNAIVLCFPKAQIVFIGDSKQLPPFKYEKGKEVRALADRPALDVVMDKKNLPVVTLHYVYRASQSLITHYSDVFYNGALLSCKPPTGSNPLACFGVKENEGRCVFWKVNGFYHKEGTSKKNPREVHALKSIIDKLERESNMDQKDIMVISYYEAQRKLAVQELPKGYEVLTVDSAQGREKRIVIVLTTRTSVPSETEEDDFFNSAKRCNVAVSRHQEALIVLGHPDIESVPNWADVLKKKYFKHVVDDTPREPVRQERVVADGWD